MIEISTLLAAFAFSPVASTPAEAPQSGKPIVVTARRLSDLEADLAACIARQCPPDKEIDAALAIVEYHFVDGNYKAARGVAQRAVARNKKYADQYPVPVSDLQRSYGRIASHLGEVAIYRNAAWGSLDALRTGLKADDSRILAARIEVADMHASTRKYDVARSIYREVAAKAEQQGHPWLAGMALLRSISVANASQTPDQGEERDLQRITADPKMANFKTALDLIRMRRSDSATRDRQIAGLIARLPKTAKPVLLFSPPIQMPGTPGDRAAFGSATDVANAQQAALVDNQWLDMGFWILPSGRVGDIAVLRESEDLRGDWPKRVTAALKDRRYSPFAAEIGDPGTFRVERYTFTADLVKVTGSLVRAPSPYPKIEMLDLTNDAAGGGAAATPANASVPAD